MLKLYILGFLRLNFKDFFTLITKILCLTISISVSFVVLKFVLYETSYDKHNKHYNTIYRIITEFPEQDHFSGSSPVILGPTIKENIPEILEYVRLANWGKTIIKNNNEFIEEGYIFECVDENYSKIFTIKFLEGNPANFLSEPNSIVVTNKFANKYFNNQNPLGEILTLKNNNELNSLIIRGVIEDLPENSSFDFQILGNIFLKKKIQNNNEWKDRSVNTFIKIPGGADPLEIENKINKLTKQFQDLGIRYHLQPLGDIYLHTSRLRDYDLSKGNIGFVRLLGLVGIIIFILGVVNLVLLSTAGITYRISEFGIRKTLGANKNDIIKQINIEGLILISFALLVAMVMIEVLQPYIENLFIKDFGINRNFLLSYIFFSIIIICLLLIIPNIFVLSAFIKINPLLALNKKFSYRIKRNLIKRFLITIQITLFLILMNFTVLIYKQLNFIKHKDLGFEKNNLLVFNTWNTNFIKHYYAFKEEALKNPNILNISGSPFGIPALNTAIQNITHFTDPSKEIVFRHYLVDYDFFKTLRIKILKGRTFSINIPSDSKNSIIINQTGVESLGLTDPLNESINSKKIIGVVDDFLLLPLQYEKVPLLINLSPGNAYNVIIRFQEGKEPEVLPMLKNLWGNFVSDTPLNFYFFDNYLDLVYKKEINFAEIVRLLTVIAIVIGCFGIIGYYYYILSYQRKEVVIKKVFGSPVGNIYQGLIKNFTLEVFISLLLSVPMSYFLMNNWLQNFAFRTQISALIFISNGIICFLIILFISGYHVIKTASTNPVEFLRYN